MATFTPSPTMGWPSRSVIWQTLKHQAVSGKVSALQEWSSPRYRYTVGFSGLRSDAVLQEWQSFLAFYNGVGGSAQVFYYDDPFDDTVTAEVFGAGNGVDTEFQLTRSLGGFTEPVYRATITSITINGVPTVAYTESGGLITFTVAPAAASAIAWTGTFEWICRFDDDILEFEGQDSNHFGLKQISFTTEKI